METAAPTLPPTPTPLVVTTTVTNVRNTTTLEVSGDLKGWKGRSLGSGGDR